MAKFKVGDKVLVKNIKEYGIYYTEDGRDRNSFTGTMFEHSGKVVTISEICSGQYRIKEDCGHWLWVDGMFEGLANDTHKIVITTDGKTTTARLFDGKELVKKAEAKCSPDDTFDFMVGAKLAMERLAEPAKKFAPHLECRGSHYGNIGETTNYKDAIGRELRIGDTIDLYDSETLKHYGEEAIAMEDGKAFVMGCEISCNAETGRTRGWKIIKKRSFEDIGNGEMVGAIKYIKEG